jgi:hypothetical protein
MSIAPDNTPVPRPGPDVVPTPVEPDATPPHGLPEAEPGRRPAEVPAPASPVPEILPTPSGPEVDPGRVHEL